MNLSRVSLDRRLAAVWRAWALMCLAATVTPVAAQARPRGETSLSVTAFAVAQLPTGIDKGGRFNGVEASAAAEVSHQFTASISLGLNAGYAAERWSWSTPTAFGSVGPWQNILRPSLGLNLGIEVSKHLSVLFSPQLEWAYESGASASDGLSHGAVIGVVKVFSPTLALGLGVGLFRQIDRKRVFPFVIVNWQLSDDLHLRNPLEAGPGGGAGLELVYTQSDDWELAGGAASRESRFRLRTEGPNPNGLGQNDGMPVFARLTRKFGVTGQIDLYAGAVLGGQLRLLNANGVTLRSSNYGTAPLLMLSGTFNF